MRVHLTERFVKAAVPAENGSAPILRDSEVVGFGLQVRPSGRKTFTLDYTIEGRKRCLFIGDFPDWSVTAARDEAKRLKREVDGGHDPLAQRDERRTAPTVKDLVDRYLDECAPRLVKASQRDRRNMLHSYVLPKWGHRKVADIRPADVDHLLAEISKGRARPSKKKTKQKRLKPLAPRKPTPIQASRVGMLIRKMFNMAIRWE